MGYRPVRLPPTLSPLHPLPPPSWKPAEGEEPLLLYTEKGTVYGYVPAEKSVSLTGTPKVPLMSGIKVLDKQKFYFSDGNNIVDESPTRRPAPGRSSSFLPAPRLRHAYPRPR